jgi:hypothetical protein
MRESPLVPELENNPFKKFFGRHWELVAAVTSGFVGALALGTSTYNVYLQRQQVRASVWPHVTMDSSSSDDGAVSIVIRNRGVGPAQIERVRVTVDGKRADDWMGALKMLLHKDTLPFIPDPSSLREEVLTPGMEVALVKVPTQRDSLEIMRATEHTPFAIEVCYCSTLDECWIVGLGEGTTAVSSCPPDAKPFVDMTDETKRWVHEYWRKKESENDGGTHDGG